MDLPVILAIVLLSVFVLGYFFWKRPTEASHAGMAFTVDLTAQARAGKQKPLVGMEDSLERMVHVLARKEKNNPLLIGEPGVGKTALVEGLAARIASGNVPTAFKSKTVVSLSLTSLMAGTKYRGELEERVHGFMTMVGSHPRQFIVFIDELHMLEQARGGEGSLDVADALKPLLASGDVQVIGATTWTEYEKYLRPDAAVDRRFQPILVQEPSRDEAIAILDGVKASYEVFHSVCIPHESVVAAVDASIAFIKNRALPDKALDVIDEACAKVSIESSQSHAVALGLVHGAAKSTKEGCGEGTPVVTVEEVHAVAEQWKNQQAARP